MSVSPLCFVHASDFHLELPLFGIAEVPPSLRDAFLDAPYRAAERVFDAALAEAADFLVLTGDLISPQNAGPRGVLFLIEQFERLAERNIPVYWAGGRVDSPDRWPSAIELPANVHRFSRGRVTEIMHALEDGPPVRILGVSRHRAKTIRPEDFFVENDRQFTVAVAYGGSQPDRMEKQAVNYWALGGQHARQTPLEGSAIAHYPGTPQGRRPAESGPHGCTLVQVDTLGTVRTSLIATDELRWHNERFYLRPRDHREAVLQKMREILAQIVDADSEVHHLVSWQIEGHGPLWRGLRRGHLTDDLLGTLRREFGEESPIAWSVALSIESDTEIPEDFHKEDTILGEFLRQVRQLQTTDEEAICLKDYLTDSQAAGALAAAAELREPELRARVLRRAAQWGAELLVGEDSEIADLAEGAT